MVETAPQSVGIDGMTEDSIRVQRLARGGGARRFDSVRGGGVWEYHHFRIAETAILAETQRVRSPKLASMMIV
jgi:hypothetical protein